MSLLTPEQVVQLTGRRKKSLQVEWLKENKIPFYINAEGYPQVLDNMLPVADLSEFDLGEVR